MNNLILATKYLKLLWLGVLFFPSCTVETEQPVIEGTTLRLSILRTSDIHSRLFPYDMKPNSHDQEDGMYLETSPYGGVERVAALIARERTRGQRVLYLDSGDIFQGAPIFNYGDGEPEFRWLSMMQPDAVALGNHEFDKGVANLITQLDRWADFPMLAANYIFDDWSDEKRSQLGRYIKPYTILNLKGLKIGVIGMGDISSMYSITQGGNSTGITPLEANETLRSWVNFLQPQVDLIIVLSHLGLSEDQELTNGHSFYMSAKVAQDSDLSGFLQRSDDPWRQMTCEECEKGAVKFWIPGVRGIDAILGGHLHILTHPAMWLTDPAGRRVLLEHPSAFARFLTRLDIGVVVPYKEYHCDQSKGFCIPADTYFTGKPCTTDDDCAVSKLAPYGAEIVSYQQELFPIDNAWCSEPRPSDPYATMFKHDLDAWAKFCDTRDHGKTRGHGPTRNLLEQYQVNMELDPRFSLTRIYGYAPKAIERKENGAIGDSPLGDITTTAMMVRKRVEAEFCVTNTLGIRDNFYPGVIDMVTVFNVFPFENTVTIMYLSGREVQDLFDYMTERSAGRGCQSQAQISGTRFVMNCGQALRNENHYPCNTPEDCCPYRPEICDDDYPGTAKWQCVEGACYSHPAEDIAMGGQPINPDASYKMATNDYIANGGSGFNVLRRNTTKIYTNIAMRDALVEYLLRYPTCEQLLSMDPNQLKSSELFALSFCLEHQDPKTQGKILVKGSCTCKDVLAKNLVKCDSINDSVTLFCQNPLQYPIVTAESDGRIVRKVK